MSIERLAPEDLVMLWADERWPQEIGALLILDPGRHLAGDGEALVETMRRAIAARLHLVPRFRQVLRVPPAGQGGPFWEDAPAFDIAEHVGVLALPTPVGDAALVAACERLLGQRLDRARPLWEMRLIPGLEDGRLGMFLKLHHCIADGIAGVASFGVFLDAGPEVAHGPSPSWTAGPPPTEADLTADFKSRRAAARKQGLAVLKHPRAALREVAEGSAAMYDLLAARPLPATSLDRLVGPDRELALLRSRLDVVKTVAHTYRVKVNDVLLAVIAGGLRELLRARAEAVPAMMRVYVPVSLRHGQYAGARGNQVAETVVPVPVGLADPVVTLHQVAAETVRRKGRDNPSVGKMPHTGIAGRVFLKLVARQRVNVTTADVPGPEVPLYLAGSRVLEVFPMLPLIGSVTLGIGAISYAGQFNLTVLADRETCPDLSAFVAGVRGALEVLAESVGLEAGYAAGPPAAA